MNLQKCLFCQIIERSRPATILFETDFGIAIQDEESDDIFLIPKLHLGSNSKSVAAVAGILLQMPILMGLKHYEAIMQIGGSASRKHLYIRIKKL